MTTTTLLFERDIDLPPVIVWEALVDPDLLVGWLGEVQLDAAAPPGIEVRWLGPDAAPTTHALVTDLIEHRRLLVATDNRGEIDISLGTIEEGTRGIATSLRLSVTVDVDEAFVGRVGEWWEISIDRLEAVLRGHPFDWWASAAHETTAASRRLEKHP